MKMLRVLPFILLALSMQGCTKVPAGYVGVKVYLLGSSKGVESEELGVGRYWIGINEELYLFPTFTQNYVWTKSPAESSPNDESFKFQTVEGMVVGADVGISYRIDPTKVSAVFQKYRKGVDEITDIYIRNIVRDSLVNEASVRQIHEVYGAGKRDLIESVEKHVRDQADEIGIIVEKVYWIGELRLPPPVTAALNAKIEATQKAQQRKNEVAQTMAEADKAREKAKGQADAIMIMAKAEAEAINIKARALKNSPLLVQLEAIQKWDGVLPKFSGGNGPVPFIDVE